MENSSINQRQENIALNTLMQVGAISLGLAILKLMFFLTTGSLLVLASFLDSVSDSIVSFLNRYIHKISLEDADKEHPFGHGGFEVFSAFIQGVLIAFFGFNLLLESFRRTFRQEQHLDFEALPLACAVLVISAAGSIVINYLFSIKIKELVDLKQRSLALLSDKTHYYGDIWTNGLSFLGLILIYFTHYEILDSLMGILSGLILIATSIPILRKSFRDIVHSEAPSELQQQIVNLVLATDNRIKGLHLLRSREFGPMIFVDFHLKVSQNLSLHEAHELGDSVENAIKRAYPRIDVIIHLDPDNEPDQEYWDPSYRLF